jgi:hypothetical protein
MVVKLGRQWSPVKTLIDEIGRVAMLTNWLATLVIQLDNHGAI